MKSLSYQQFAIVTGDTAQLLTDRLNAKLYELRDKNPVVTFEGLIARISYVESHRINEDVVDEYEEQGVRLSCQDCPYFKPILKADGTEDKRVKWGDCEFSHHGYGRTSRNSAACKKLFEALNSGEVRLCLAE